MKYLKTTIFWLLVLFFIILIFNSFVFILRGWLFLLFIGILFLLGLIQTILSWKGDTFLLLTGLSCVGFPLFVILHNLFYAVDIGMLEGLFFLLAIPVCPIVFLVGIIGTITRYKFGIIE